MGASLREHCLKVLYPLRMERDVSRIATAEGVPLVIGVTGHRDLLYEEQEGIKLRVRGFFEQMRERFPDLPLMVMTPLAEGADRIAAEVAHELGIPIMVLLPMPRHLYESDFEGDSLSEFQTMRELGEQIELPLLPELTETDVVSQGAGRDLQYAQLGAYLAAHSHVLLAIWDGKPSNAPGGTGHVIKFHQHDVIELIAEGQHRSPIDFTEDESDLVYHVVCSRRESGPPEPGLEPGQAYWYTRDELKPRTLYMPDRYRVVFERMAEFSSDLRLPMDPEDFYPLLPEEDLAQCGQGARDIDRLYHRADALARRYQAYFFRALQATGLLGLTAGVCFVAFADWPVVHTMLLPYILCIVLVLSLGALDRRFSWQRKYLDYRVLAEGLRVQFWWAVAGVEMENPSRFSHDSFLKRQDLELGWIRNVMRYAGFRSDSTDRSSSEDLVALCMSYWVSDQHKYYAQKALERERRQRVTGLFNVAGLLLLVVAAVTLAARADLVEVTLGSMLIALMGLVPFAIAARQNYAFRTAESELLAQFQHYVRIYQNAINLMSKAPTLLMKQDILRAVGEAALEENGQWILRQRERPSVPTRTIQG
ncbi:MAG: hypothetical protein EP301_05315 [Gammaproteobacteria bacterium]|nr:MAG: hypothetical protein EP301_05315 [Gammaproteobacteria bacterium]